MKSLKIEIAAEFEDDVNAAAVIADAVEMLSRKRWFREGQFADGHEVFVAIRQPVRLADDPPTTNYPFEVPRVHRVKFVLRYADLCTLDDYAAPSPNQWVGDEWWTREQLMREGRYPIRAYDINRIPFANPAGTVAMDPAAAAGDTISITGMRMLNGGDTLVRDEVLRPVSVNITIDQMRELYPDPTLEAGEAA